MLINHTYFLLNFKMSALIFIKNMIVYSFPLITLIGLITNTISFVIFSGKKFQNSIFSTYFRFLLLFHTLNLISPSNKLLEWNFDFYFSQLSNFSCKIRYWFFYVNFAIAAWFQVIISIDRYLAISLPTKFILRKKFQFQIITSFIIIGFNCCMYIPSLMYYLKINNESSPIINQTTKSNYKCTSPGIWADFMDLFQSTVLPFCLMILFTLLTIRTVFKSRRSSTNSSLSSVNKSKDIKFAFTSILTNIIFILFNLPVFLVDLINDYTKVTDGLFDVYLVFNAISYFVYYSNNFLTFFINYYVNSMFKKELLIVLNVVSKN